MLERTVAVFQLAGRGWQREEVGDFGALNCLLLLAIAIGIDTMYDLSRVSGMGSPACILRLKQEESKIFYAAYFKVST